MKEIFTRHSVRQYKDTPIDKAALTTIVRAGMAAPTAGNQREWDFIVVTDKGLLKKLSEASPYARMTAGAAAAIVITMDLDKCRFPELWQQDGGAAAENILLEARHLGIGGVWLAIAPFEDRMQNVSAIFDLPEHVKPFTVIPLGVPAKPLPTEDDREYDMSKVHDNAF